MVIFGAILLVFGLIFMFIPFVGWLLGLPMMVTGAVLCAVGAGRSRQTVIHNTVAYSTTHPHPPGPYAQPMSGTAVATAPVANAPTALTGLRACPSCGAQSSASGRFCNHCGTQLPA